MKLIPLLALVAASAFAADANRLTYLDDSSPFWPGPGSPKFTTPQWIGEPGVDAVIVLAIDDMRDPAKYEAFLRPILDRLKKIDGRAPVSIMTNVVDPGDPQLQTWLKEGLSLEVHTLAHPCPCLGKMIEDYPFPYLIGGNCWEFPCIVPSDWEAFNILGPQSAVMLDDWKAALDRIVEQKGVFTAVFHPHGWSGVNQWVEFIDYAERTYGKRVKFLNFREAQERLTKVVPPGNLLVDLDGDGVMEIGRPDALAYGIVRNGAVSCLTKDGAWTWRDQAWQSDPAVAHHGAVLLRDFDRDGVCELLTGSGIFVWKDGWQPADFALPPGFAPFDAQGRDNGLRFVDLNGDGFDDVIQSNDAGNAIYLWAGTVKANLGWKRGWPHLVAQDSAKLLPFVKDGKNNGAWFHRGFVVWQNEALATPQSESIRRSFAELIAFPVPPEKSPEEALAALRPRPGFTVELVAAEPLVDAPVAFEWDARGRLWVVEMRDYPLGMDGKGKPGGVVKILTDSDGDGRYDHAQVVLEDLPFPTGVLPWRTGALIASSPDLLFADENGRRVLFTGFKEGNQQHRFNGFEWGLDGWVYGANGDSGGVVGGVDISGRDFRFREDRFEAESGQTQYGRRRDDWGNWFGNNNPNWLWHYTISDAALRRNPKLAVKTIKRMLANYAESTRVFPVSELPVRFNQPQSLGHVTSACSPSPYRDELFGPGFATSVFTCEPVHNVVHREVLSPDGATFTSRRADDEQDREFLASTDPWFRPVHLKTGPDGALYIADFHRFVLEHPEWIAPETQSRVNLRAGAGKGRIFRILPAGAKLRPIPNLEALESSGLAAALDSPNGWQRDTVQRLLIERKAQDAVPGLRKLVTESQNPKVRAQALASLDTLGALDPDTVRLALKDADPRVRVQALRCADLAETLTCANDPEFIVRHQFALRLGDFRDERATAALEQIAAREGDNPQMRLAILSSVPPDSALFAKLNDAAKIVIPPAVILPKPSTADRAKVIASYASVAALPGNPKRGHELYKQSCIVCHRLNGEGMEAGPDLAMVADKPVDWLLTAIMDPNAAMEDRFKTWTIKLKSGVELNGILSAETANNIVLRLPGGVDYPVLRTEIASQNPSGKSLMPEGMETVLKPQDAADLIAYLRTARH